MTKMGLIVAGFVMLFLILLSIVMAIANSDNIENVNNESTQPKKDSELFEEKEMYGLDLNDDIAVFHISVSNDDDYLNLGD